jgi:hypothetical protein
MAVESSTAHNPAGGHSAPAGGLPLGRVVVAVAKRPDLWSTAVRSALSLAPSRWWRHRPFLPLPDQHWLRFRMSTAYGGDGDVGPDSAFDTEDLITWLEWRRTWPG